MTHTELIEQAEQLVKSPDPEAKFAATQIALNLLPPSYFVENYLEDNEGRPQSLENFPMLRGIYDCIPQRMLLKCSRKTLKSTLLSNLITLNMVRWNKYAQLYVGPQEISVKYFSQNYVEPRFDSRKLKRLLVNGWRKNDVFEKRLKDTDSSVIFRYVKDDATRIRGPAVDCVNADEIQDINADTLPIINETMTMSEFKREMYTGTPLTVDNTINILWKSSNMLEWYTKCGCGHWNSLTIDNEPLKMILEHGFSCSKCSRIIDTRHGEWVSLNPARTEFLIGYHLAQPLLPHFNQNPKEWHEFYTKVTDGKYSVRQIYNEAFGIAFDEGVKPITEEELRKLCVLGSMRGTRGDAYPIHSRHKNQYTFFSVGADWGVNGITSKTAHCVLGMCMDGMIHCISAKTYSDHNYNQQIKDIATIARDLGAKCVCDAGPAPDRGIRLAELTNPAKTCLVIYSGQKLIQQWVVPAGAVSWQQARWSLHRSDTISLVFKMLKNGKILFPCWDEMSHILQDILNEFIEIKQTEYSEHIRYRHDPNKPDDFLHALNYALCGLLSQTGDRLLEGASSDNDNFF